MSQKLTIDFVSDVSCSWCAIGLTGLDEALRNIADEADVDLRFHPFELNPSMEPGGQNLSEHLQEKYRLSPAEASGMMEQIRARGEEVGFAFRFDDEMRIYNSFDTHRILHWAGLQGRQAELKRALFAAHFSDQEDPGDHDVLVRLAGSVGLDESEARRILSTQQYAAEVRNEESQWIEAGVTGVPVVVLNGKYALSGARSAETYERQLRQVLAEEQGEQR